MLSVNKVYEFVRPSEETFRIVVFPGEYLIRFRRQGECRNGNYVIRLLPARIIEINQVFCHYVLTIINHPDLLLQSLGIILRLFIKPRVIGIRHDGFVRIDEFQPLPHEGDEFLFQAVPALVLVNGFRQVLVIGFAIHPVEQFVNPALLV